MVWFKLDKASSNPQALTQMPLCVKNCFFTNLLFTELRKCKNVGRALRWQPQPTFVLDTGHWAHSLEGSMGTLYVSGESLR
jgi:hypothetical protein